jgi:hypothetical protein
MAVLFPLLHAVQKFQNVQHDGPASSMMAMVCILDFALAKVTGASLTT